MKKAPPQGIGNLIAPWRFLAFTAVAIATGAALLAPLGWRAALMLDFDLGALLFMGLCTPLFSDEAEKMRRDAKKNDANRVLLLVITMIVSAVIMIEVASALMQKGERRPMEVALVIATLCLSWLFSNLVYALHYAHLFYTADR